MTFNIRAQGPHPFRPDLEPQVGFGSKLGSAGIDHDQFAPRFSFASRISIPLEDGRPQGFRP